MPTQRPQQTVTASHLASESFYSVKTECGFPFTERHSVKTECNVPFTEWHSVEAERNVPFTEWHSVKAELKEIEADWASGRILGEMLGWETGRLQVTF